jgi:hypothetical protein
MVIQPNTVPNSDDEMRAGTERRPAIAVDFDGVIAEYEGWQGKGVLGQPRMDVVQVLHLLQQDGWKIVIHTTRSEKQIIEYLLSNKIPHDEINRNSSYENEGSKPVATIYWDDRALRYSGNAFEDLKSIRSFRTWNGRI